MWHALETVPAPGNGGVRIGRQGRVVIPAAVRRDLALKAGDELVARVDGSRLILQRREDLLRELQDELRAVRGERSLVDELIAERHADARRERE